MKEYRIVYASRDRVCLERDGVVVHAELAANRIEARTVGPGGPMSGEVIARSDHGVWTVPPSDANYHDVDEMFEQASRLMRDKASDEGKSPI